MGNINKISVTLEYTREYRECFPDCPKKRKDPNSCHIFSRVLDFTPHSLLHPYTMDVDSDCLRDGELSSALNVAALLLLCLLPGTRAYSGVSTQNEKAEEEVVCLQIRHQPPALKHLSK